MLKIVIGMGNFAIRIDADKSDTARSEVIRRLSGDFIRSSNIRTMVTGEEDDQRVGLVKIGQLRRIRLPQARKYAGMLYSPDCM